MKLEEEEEERVVVVKTEGGSGLERLSVDHRVSVLLRLESPQEVVKLAWLSKSWGDVVRDYLHLYMQRLRGSSPGVVIATYTPPWEWLSGRVYLYYLLPCGRLRFLMTLGSFKNTVMLPYSINGLLLFANGGVDFILCNPTTRQCRTLPTPDPKCPPDAAVGFGYSPSTDEYKVVTIWQQNINIGGQQVSSSWACNVMTLTNAHDSNCDCLLGFSWRRVEYALGHRLCRSTSIFLDGAIYFCDADDDEMVISFDVRDETFRMFRGPPIGQSAAGFRKFLLLQGRLCLAKSRLGGNEHTPGWDAICVWMMVSEGEWVRHLKFEFEVLRPQLQLEARFSNSSVDISWIAAKDRFIVCRLNDMGYYEATIFDLNTQTKVGETAPLPGVIIGQTTIEESLLPLRCYVGKYIDCARPLRLCHLCKKVTNHDESTCQLKKKIVHNSEVNMDIDEDDAQTI